MALITCPECGRQISEYAEKCPGCGWPVQREEDRWHKEKSKVQGQGRESGRSSTKKRTKKKGGASPPRARAPRTPRVPKGRKTVHKTVKRRSSAVPVILTIIIMLLILAMAAGAAYYYFFVYDGRASDSQPSKTQQQTRQIENQTPEEETQLPEETMEQETDSDLDSEEDPTNGNDVPGGADA